MAPRKKKTPAPAGPSARSDRARSELLLYTTPDLQTRIEVRLEDETVWLTQRQMADLFQTTVQNISLHVGNIFAEGELRPESVIKESLITAADGKSYLPSNANR